jgi:hypothetical protein
LAHEASSFILLTGLYLDADAHRRAEFLECIRLNAKNCFIDQVVVFLECETDPKLLLSSYPELASTKVILISHRRRLTYKDLFSYANSQLTGRRVMIANADIYFDETLGRLDGYELAGKLLCLSRWDVQANGCSRFFDYPSSQDAWIFVTPLREFPCAFYLGVLGCDNRLAWEAARVGMEVSNPSRSVRAHHLHLTGVRRYSSHERMPGPVLPVPTSFLETLWLWFVVPCRDRLQGLQQTLGSIDIQPKSSCVVVNYSRADGTSDWVAEQYPRTYVLRCDGQSRFREANARNRGAAVAHDDGVLCFVDTGVIVASEFSSHILARIRPGTFLVPDDAGQGSCSTLVCHKADFDKAGAFDEAFVDASEAVADLRRTLCRAGLNEEQFSASMLQHLYAENPDESAHSKRGKTLQMEVAYRRSKEAAIDIPLNLGCFEAALHDWECARSTTEDANEEVKCAAVAFHETMGYTIARLEAGATSHNNDLRPFAALPVGLKGRQYTQVVSCSTSTIDIEFLSSGKLYVLVGTDWDGHRMAAAWLREVGQREMMPPVLTHRHTAFEVWSLRGEAGDRLTAPTQVMLVASYLKRV